jgi:tagatose 6-phosphate kinase
VILIVGQNTAWQNVCILPRLCRGEVNRVDEVLSYPGGKGVNAARALSCLGKTAKVLGYAGGRTGELLAEWLQKEGIGCHLTLIRAETRTCTTYAEQDGTTTECIEPSPEVTPGERELFRTIFRKHIGDARILLICGTTVRGETLDCYSFLISEARGRGVPVLLDSASPAALHALQGSPEILKVNLAELARIVGRPLPDPSSRTEAYSTLSRHRGIRWFFTTLGAEGIEGYDGSRIIHASPPRVSLVNAIGSGDAASAGIGAVLEDAPAGADAFSSVPLFERALKAAAAMGTANCMNAVGGRVEKKDFLDVMEKTVLKWGESPSRSTPGGNRDTA